MASLAQPMGHKKAQDRQMEKLQKQLIALEKQNSEKALLMDRLEHLSRLDTERTQRALDRASSSNRTLKDEIERTYGADDSPRSVNSNAVEEIIAKRTKDFQRSQAEKALNMQLLVQERLRILEARDRLKAKQEIYRSLPSPLGSNFTVIEVAPQGVRPAAPRSVHSSGSYVRRAIEDFPNAMDRIWNLRDSLHDDYIKKRKPYAGELGISSYLPRQIPSYKLVRGIVEEFVDKFVTTHIPADYKVRKQDMKLQNLNKQKKDWEKTSKVLSEQAAVQLVMEELLLEVTSAMTKDVATEGIHQDLMYKKMSANLFIREAESQATGNPRGRDPNDPAYDLITNTFNTLQKNRDHFKKRVWTHSQLVRHNGTPPPQVIHIVPPLPPKTKKKSKITKTPPQAPASVPKMATVEENIDF